MSAVVIAKFEKKRDADLVTGLIRKMKSNAHVISAKDWEDVYLAEMIDEGMKEEGEIPEAEFSSWLKRKIKSTQ